MPDLRFDPFAQPPIPPVDPDSGHDGLPVVKVPPPRPLPPAPVRRRRRDWLWALLLGNGTFAGLLIVLPRNPVTVIFGVAGAIIFSVGTLWICFVVQNRD